MIVVAVFMWALACVLAVFVFRAKGAAGVGKAGRFAVKQARGIALRLPLALLAAAFLAKVLPTDAIGRVMGESTGAAGIVLAAFLGGLLPGGPMASFPIALFMWQAGAGTPQMVALLAGWSVFAFHRVLAFEAPLMGWRFSALRLASSFFLPPAAGLLAAILVHELSLGDLFAP